MFSFVIFYMGKIVKVEGVGPGRVASGSSGSTLNTDNYGTSTTGPFNASHVGRMIRRFRSYRDTTMDPTVIRKQILWEGVVAELTDANTITTGTAIDSTGNGVETALSGGADYSSAASAWSENGDSWEIIGYYGKIVAIVNSTTIQVENVGSDTALTFNGYKDANFYSWGTGNAANLAAGGIEYFIESAEEMINSQDRANNGEFYIGPTYNYMIKKGLKVGIHHIPNQQHHPIGVPEDLKKYIEYVNKKT